MSRKGEINDCPDFVSDCELDGAIHYSKKQKQRQNTKASASLPHSKTKTNTTHTPCAYHANTTNGQQEFSGSRLIVAEVASLFCVFPDLPFQIPAG